MSSSEKLVTEYLPKQQLYRGFACAIKFIVRQALFDTDIKVYSIVCREKDPEKLREKVARKFSDGKEYKTLEDIEDLAGVRIVTYLDSHKEQVATLIYQEFEDANPKFEEKYDPKGYRGTHLVIHLDPARKKLAEYSRYKELKCEIQVTSILYHAWSEIEHDVIYKPGENPKELEDLGLDDIENAFEKIMAQHLEEATVQFDFLFRKHKEIVEAGKVLYSDFVNDIKNAETNDQIAIILDIADRFSHKKPEEALQIAKATIERDKLDPKVIHKIGKEKIFGKGQKDLFIKSIGILLKIRYLKIEQSLSLLFLLANCEEKDVSKKALEAIREYLKYDINYIIKYKNYLPKKASLEFIKKLSASERKDNIHAVSAVAEEILSSSVEAWEQSTVDTFTRSSGAIVPNEGLKQMRRDTIAFIEETYGIVTGINDKILLIKVLGSALEIPHNVAYDNDLTEMIVDDIKFLIPKFENLIISPKGEIEDCILAKRVENILRRIPRREEFTTEEAKNLQKKLCENDTYQIFCLLVGGIFEYKDPEEDWQEAENRRSKEIDELVGKITIEEVDKWYVLLNQFVSPLKEKALKAEKYNAFELFIARLTIAKPEIAETIFSRGIDENSDVSEKTIARSYLSALREKNDFRRWDEFVSKIKDNNVSRLVWSIVDSLNLSGEKDLTSSIRNEDIGILSKIIQSEEPFSFIESDDFTLRRSLIITLARIFNRDHSEMESLIIKEISCHPNCLNIYFQDLPFVESRNWIGFRDWSESGVNFLKQKMIDLEELDWHTQKMLLELSDESIQIVLEVFKGQVQKKIQPDMKRRYEAIPYDLNPDLQKYLSEHPDYVSEMVKWLKDITLEWSTYNWNVSLFIKRIGGASYASILLKLIEINDHDSLEKASYAINSFDGADFDLCFEIVKRTNDKDILNRVAGSISNMGVVSGEDGVAKAYESKAKLLENYTSSEDNRVKVFAENLKSSFEESANREYQRAMKQKKTREAEFDL